MDLTTTEWTRTRRWSETFRGEHKSAVERVTTVRVRCANDEIPEAMDRVKDFSITKIGPDLTQPGMFVIEAEKV